MVNRRFWLEILAVVLVFGVLFVGCSDGGGNDDPPPSNPPSNPPGTTPSTTPGQKTAAERWSSWSDSASTATITHSVGADDICIITIGGDPITTQPAYDHLWKATAEYEYTAIANKYYIFEIEAWAEGDNNRKMNIQWYSGDEYELNPQSYETGYYQISYDIDTGTEEVEPRFDIGTAKSLYTIRTSERIPKDGKQALRFQCANQTGTFYVKIISITAIDNVPNYLDTLTLSNITPSEAALTKGNINQSQFDQIKDGGGSFQGWEHSDFFSMVWTGCSTANFESVAGILRDIFGSETLRDGTFVLNDSYMLNLVPTPFISDGFYHDTGEMLLTFW